MSSEHLFELSVYSLPGTWWMIRFSLRLISSSLFIYSSIPASSKIFSTVSQQVLPFFKRSMPCSHFFEFAFIQFVMNRSWRSVLVLCASLIGDSTTVLFVLHAFPHLPFRKLAIHNNGRFCRVAIHAGWCMKVLQTVTSPVGFGSLNAIGSVIILFLPSPTFPKVIKHWVGFLILKKHRHHLGNTQAKNFKLYQSIN